MLHQHDVVAWSALATVLKLHIRQIAGQLLLARVGTELLVVDLHVECLNLLLNGHDPLSLLLVALLKLP